MILDEKEDLIEGNVTGRVIEDKRGTAVFGYGPIFIAEGYEQTFAELGEEVKNQISHRSRAVHKLCKFLNSIQ